MDKKLIVKIVGGVLALVLVGGLGYFLSPEKIVKVEKEVKVEVEVEVEKEVTKFVYVPKIIEVEKVVETVVEVPVGNSAELVALRADKVDGWVDVLEKKIDKFEDKIGLIDDSIEVVQDKIDAKTDANKLLQSKVNSNQTLIDALVLDSSVGNLAQIQSLSSANFGFKATMDSNQNKVDGWLEDIADLEVTKEPWQGKVDLDTLCVSEINAYVASGLEFSDDVSDRLKLLNLL